MQYNLSMIGKLVCYVIEWHVLNVENIATQLLDHVAHHHMTHAITLLINVCTKYGKYKSNECSSHKYNIGRSRQGVRMTFPDFGPNFLIFMQIQLHQSKFPTYSYPFGSASVKALYVVPLEIRNMDELDLFLPLFSITFVIICICSCSYQLV